LYYLFFKVLMLLNVVLPIFQGIKFSL